METRPSPSDLGGRPSRGVGRGPGRPRPRKVSTRSSPRPRARACCQCCPTRPGCPFRTGGLDGRAALLRLAVARAPPRAEMRRLRGPHPRRRALRRVKGADYMAAWYPRPELRPAGRRPAGPAGPDRRRVRPPWPRPGCVAGRAPRGSARGAVVLRCVSSSRRRDRRGASQLRAAQPPTRRLSRAGGKARAGAGLGPPRRASRPPTTVAYHAISLERTSSPVPSCATWTSGRMLRLWPDASRRRGRARDWRTARALYGALRQAGRFFPELDRGETATIARSLVGPAARGFLDRCVLPPAHEQGRAGVVTRPRQLWRKFWLMDGIRARAGFALAHMSASVAGQSRSARPGMTDRPLRLRQPTSTLALAPRARGSTWRWWWYPEGRAAAACAACCGASGAGEAGGRWRARHGGSASRSTCP